MNLRLLPGVLAILLGPASDLSARTIVPNAPLAANHAVGLVRLDRVIAHSNGAVIEGPVIDRRNLMKLAGSKPGGTGEGFGDGYGL